MIVVGLTGLKRSGKDTVADRLVEQHGFTKVAFADPLREMALALDPLVADGYHLSDAVTDLGWEEAKEYPEVRRTLQRLGTEVIRGFVDNSYWVDEMHDRLLELRADGVERVVISDARFENEVDLVVDDHAWFLWAGFVVRVDRPGMTIGDGHASEHPESLHHDYVITNDGTLDDLHAKVDSLAASLTPLTERKPA